ncbi:MAG TPA: VOC family protein [Bryobacteraceae bacterium]|nr:VOC family protein [Bryobacteraceae bacterium]
MLRTGLFFFVITSLGAADLAVDHVSVAGANLKGMRERLKAVGIPSEYGGPHANGATEMAVTSFPDGSYLELIAIQVKPDAKALEEHYWSKQMRANAGPAAWAVRVADLSAEAARLKTAGIQVFPLSRSGRTRPDGRRLDWETARVGPEPNGAFFPFLIRDFTPRADRAFPSGKPTTTEFTGIRRVVIAVRELKASTARFRQAYGLAEPAERDDPGLGARLAVFEGSPVILANGPSLNARIEQFGEAPCAFVLGSAKPGPKGITWLDAEKLGWRLGVER